MSNKKSGGAIYEDKIIAVCKEASNIIGNSFTVLDEDTSTFNSHEVDLKIQVKGAIHFIELKKSSKEQMGGTSLRYDYDTKLFSFANTDSGILDRNISELLISAAIMKISAIDKYIEKAREIDFTNTISGIPITVKKEVRNFLTKNKFAVPINGKVLVDSNFIINHYNKKNVFYIQIGGSGLFYLGSNPLKLDIPKLEGQIAIEIRLGYAGSGGRPNVRATLRAQGRLQFNLKSNRSLDNIDDILHLFG